MSSNGIVQITAENFFVITGPPLSEEGMLYQDIERKPISPYMVEFIPANKLVAVDGEVHQVCSLTDEGVLASKIRISKCCICCCKSLGHNGNCRMQLQKFNYSECKLLTDPIKIQKNRLFTRFYDGLQVQKRTDPHETHSGDYNIHHLNGFLKPEFPPHIEKLFKIVQINLHEIVDVRCNVDEGPTGYIGQIPKDFICCGRCKSGRSFVSFLSSDNDVYTLFQRYANYIPTCKNFDTNTNFWVCSKIKEIQTLSPSSSDEEISKTAQIISTLVGSSQSRKRKKT